MYTYRNKTMDTMDTGWFTHEQIHNSHRQNRIIEEDILTALNWVHLNVDVKCIKLLLTFFFLNVNAA